MGAGKPGTLGLMGQDPLGALIPQILGLLGWGSQLLAMDRVLI